MSDVPFYRTQMGHRFYEHTLPELVRQIARVADALEGLAVDRATERSDVGPVTAPTTVPPPDR